MPNIYGPVPTNILDSNTVTQYVVQQPVQQLYQQQIVQPVVQGDNGNFWEVNGGSEAYTNPQNETTTNQATPQYSNLNVNTIPQTSGQYVVVSSSNSGGGKTGVMIIAGIVIGAVLLVILSGVLYVWASNLAAENSNLERKIQNFTEEDLNLIESKARFKYGLIKEGEHFFKVNRIVESEASTLPPSVDSDGTGEEVSELGVGSKPTEVPPDVGPVPSLDPIPARDSRASPEDSKDIAVEPPNFDPADASGSRPRLNATGESPLAESRPMGSDPGGVLIELRETLESCVS